MDDAGVDSSLATDGGLAPLLDGSHDAAGLGDASSAGDASAADVADAGPSELTDAGVLLDSGFVRLPKTPGAIYCRHDEDYFKDAGLRDCVAGTEACCVGLPSRCVSDGGAACGLHVACEGAEDCPSGSKCCEGDTSAGVRTYCAVNCAGVDTVVCSRNSDCSGVPGTSCCHVTVGVDASPGAYVSLSTVTAPACLPPVAAGRVCDVP